MTAHGRASWTRAATMQAALLVLLGAIGLASPEPDGRAAAPSGAPTYLSPSSEHVLLSAPEGTGGPYVLRTRFLAGDDAASLAGVWLAGLAPQTGEPPRVLAVAWSPVSSGWFGTLWTLHLATAHDVLPRSLSPAPGTGFLEGLQAGRLGNAQPRSGHLYETILSYHPEEGLLSVRVVDLTEVQIIVERGVQLAPLDPGGALVPVAGFAAAPAPSTGAPPGVVGEPAPEEGETPLSRFTAFTYEQGFLPFGIGWSIQQRASPGAPWSRARALDRRLETRADVRLPWNALPGRLAVRAGGDLDVVLADAPADARQLSLPLEISHLPAGERELVLSYQDEHGTWDVLEETVAMGRLAVRFEDLRVDMESEVRAGSDPLRAFVSGNLAVESDGPVQQATLRLYADVASFDRDYWLASALDGTVKRGALQTAVAASDLVLIDNLTVDVPAEGMTIPFAAALPVDGATPPPGGGWVAALRPEIEAPVPVFAPERESAWLRRKPAVPETPGDSPPDAEDAAAPAADDSLPRAGGELTVMVYNIRHGRGIDNAVDLERIAAVIREAGPDVVGLNEVDRMTARTGGVDQAATLARMLDMHLAYGANITYQGGLYGNAVLSRFPITSAVNLALPSGSEQRGLLHVTLDAGGREVHFLTTHLGLSAQERELQLATIADYVAKLSGPVILGGDFNLEWGADRALGPKLRDAWRLQIDEGRLRTARSGLTFPSARPAQRIDYIFLSKGIELRGDDPVRTIASLASDHLPVVARIALPR